MILFIKKNIYAFKFILLCFTRYKLYKHNTFLFVFKIYLIKVLFSYKSIRQKFLKSRIINFQDNDFFEKPINSNEIIKQIDVNGISDKLNLKDIHINDILNEINNTNNLNYGDKKFLNLDELIKEKLNQDISRIAIPIDLDKNKKIFQILTSNLFKSVSRGYLNSNKVSINCTLLISFPKNEMSDKDKISAAQTYHFDSDFSKFLKLYVYLNNVDKNNGPHSYVTKTHIQKQKKHQLQKGYSDKQITQSYDSIKIITGKKGTIFFEDSFGFHKGNVPKNNYRIMLNIHYGNSNIKYTKYDKLHFFED